MAVQRKQMEQHQLSALYHPHPTSGTLIPCQSFKAKKPKSRLGWSSQPERKIIGKKYRLSFSKLKTHFLQGRRKRTHENPEPLGQSPTLFFST